MSIRSGTFRVAPDREVDGTLSLAGLNTLLHLWDYNPFAINQLSGATITGVLDNLTKVSLIKCFVTGESCNHRSDGTTVYGRRVAPHYVVIGEQHFSFEGCDVHEISFTFDDAKVLFLDRFSVLHISSICSGVSVYSDQKGDVFVKIRFDRKIGIIEAVSRMNRVLQFFELMVGRIQNVLEINIYPQSDPDSSTPIPGARLHISMEPRRGCTQEKYEPGFTNILIDPVRDSEAFSSVLKAWLARDEEWRTARERLSSGWGKRNYDHDRIIRAANGFDLLPTKKVFGEGEPLPKQVKVAVDKAKKIFRELPKGNVYRERLLNAVSMATRRWPLREKVHHRAERIIEEIGDLIPKIGLVIDKAVECRHLYVHGNGDNSELCDSCVVFLTNTLEFIFFASDLVDAGWDIAGWGERRHSYGHPLADYLHFYRIDLDGLEGKR